ncbi:MAG: thiamine phosphate synthase [Prevotellaceae bacterium]|nr:thiamine phosphate synthase [Candidatus Colivivens equi]MCQ2076066.1 thiamine phosphate synthase [Bacteroidaceae bacterium]
MKLIVATCPSFFVEENAILEALFEEGMDYLHLDKPDSEPIYCERLLSLLNNRWHKRIIVNDHFYLRNEYNLRGIHLSKRHPELPNSYVGFYTRTCYTIEEIDYWKKRANYVIANDINDETLHRYKMAGVIDSKVAAHQLHSIEEIKKIRDAGFGAIVVQDLLWNQFDFHQSNNYKVLIDIFRKIRKACG